MFPCAGCKAKDDEIKHLRALVDSILIGKGLAPVTDAAPAALEPIEIPDIKEEQEVGASKTYGGD